MAQYITDSVQEPVSLAATALEDFWDTSRKLVFLGEGCRLYHRRGFWEKIPHETQRHPFEEPGVFEKGIADTQACYERWLPLLGEALNRVQGTSHGLRYWRIVLGPWLSLYIDSYHERYLCLQKALAEHKNMTTIGLAESSYVYPRDAMDLVNLHKTDEYNLQMYTRILDFLGMVFPRKTFSFGPRKRAGAESRGWKGILGDVAAKVFLRRVPVFMHEPFIRSKKVKIHFLKEARGALWIGAGADCPLPSFPRDKEKRKTIASFVRSKNEFERMIAQFLEDDIPDFFVEGFAWAREQSARRYPYHPKVIMSAISWHYTDLFKLWCGARAEQGCRLMGLQHGMNYGISLYHPFENHEMTISNRYYSWGWERADAPCEVRPMPSLKMIGRTNTYSGKKDGDIVWATIARTRFFYRYAETPVFKMEDYLAWQQRFMSCLPEELRYRTRVRLFSEDRGWSCAERWKDFDPKIKLEDWSMTFHESLGLCRMNISDYPSSTFVEGMMSGKPTIVFWDPALLPIRKEAEPYFEALRRVDILHDSPESAAKTVSRVFERAEEWWEEPERKKAVEFFCDRFVRTSPDALAQWVAEIRKISKGL